METKLHETPKDLNPFYWDNKMAEAVSATDQKYLRYNQELKGWKIRKDSKFHCDDLGIKSPVYLKNDIKYYNNKRVGMAIFGLGRIGVIHLENVVKNPRMKLLYCMDPCEERCNFVQHRWNLCPESMVTCMENVDKIFQDPNVDCVVVCTPTQTHEELVLRSLNAGKAVFCEKPIAPTYEGIKRCYELAEKIKKPLFCAFNREFDSGFKYIKEHAKKELGQIQVIKTCSRDSPLPSVSYLKTSGGIFHDCAVHDIDVICWILEEFPTSVIVQAHAFIPEIKEMGDYDTVGIMMKFESGAIACIDLSRFSCYGYDQRIEVFGPKGMFNSGDLRPTPITNYSANGSTSVPIFYSFASRYQEAYFNEMEHLADVMQGICDLRVSGKRTLAVSKIASACEESAKTGKIVELNWS
ncbi:uncharacterized protein LOC111637468 [Centruroides sculpturatus]|uniref:uncharacterized protein LOC111637468 n=1 Tax=Centruroides sculpturatus TaxID=218467 RepID=UPI000C6D776C|nr:uncharacterized protein LOC111637468 [Centruroides sculpturatus]